LSRPPIISGRSGVAVRGAFGAGADRLIAVPGTGSYQLAARSACGDAVRRLEALSGSEATTPAHYVVGHRDQAAALVGPRYEGQWSDDARRLAARCWPGPLSLLLAGSEDREPVLVSMASTRALRRLCRESGPWRVAPLAEVTADAVADHYSVFDVALVADAGPCRGPGATVVDCTGSEPWVSREGALPASFIEAALFMGTRRRWWSEVRWPTRPPRPPPAGRRPA